MNISISIMAHASRDDLAIELHDRMTNMPFSKLFLNVQDGEKGILNEWKNGRNCWEQGIGSDWHIVIQDDSIISDNFYQNVVGALEALPEKTAVSFYTGMAKPYPETIYRAVSEARDKSFLVYDKLLWGVCFAINGAYIDKMIEFCDNVHDRVEYDRRISEYFRVEKIPVFYTNPSISDHNDALPSILGHEIKYKRIAHRYEPGLVNWNSETHRIT